MLIKDDFYDERNAKVYEVMLELYIKNKPVDIITVKERLDDK
jgi:replicative DNA helicase